jgi:hypothetical protein
VKSIAPDVAAGFRYHPAKGLEVQVDRSLIVKIHAAGWFVLKRVRLERLRSRWKWLTSRLVLKCQKELRFVIRGSYSVACSAASQVPLIAPFQIIISRRPTERGP